MEEVMIRSSLVTQLPVELLRLKERKVGVFRQLWENNRFMKGQALMTLIFFMVIGITVTTGAIGLILVNSINGSKQQQGELAYQVAESGVENALIRVLRTPPPAYMGEVLTVGTGTATITATGSGTPADPIVILSKGQVGNYLRQIEVRTKYQNNLLEIVSQREVFQ